MARLVQNDILPQHAALVREVRVRFASLPSGEPRYPEVRVEYEVFELRESLPTRYIAITDPTEAQLVCAHVGWDPAWATTRTIAIGVPIL